jgi:tetratricopeptide (TPR) repeat protein
MARRKIPTKPSVTVYTPQVRRGIPEFPSISRSIPELKIPSLSKVYNTPAFFFHLTSIIVILAIVYQGSMFFQTWKKYSSLQQEEAKLYQEVSYWQDITTKFSNYRDGYFSLAVLYYRLGNDSKAKENLEKVLSIDPRFEQGIAFAQVLK